MNINLYVGDLYCGARRKFYRGSKFQDSCEQTAIDFCRGGAIKSHIDSIPGCAIDSNQELNNLKEDCEPAFQCLLGIEINNDVCDCVLGGDC